MDHDIDSESLNLPWFFPIIFLTQTFLEKIASCSTTISFLCLPHFATVADLDVLSIFVEHCHSFMLE